MKPTFTLIFALFSIVNLVTGQDTLYIYKSGEIVIQQAITEIDSITFQKLEAEPIVYDVYDIDGNGYDTIKIGDQTWFVQNLKTTHFNDAVEIPNVSDNVTWGGLASEAYCWFNNDPASPMGALYNYYTVSTFKLCPSGWHVPTFDEWNVLIDELGGEEVAGGKMKTTTGWSGDNLGASNESGFSGLPAGYRTSDGSFVDYGWATRWWTETEEDSEKARFKMLHTVTPWVWQGAELKTDGYSVRCIKD